MDEKDKILVIKLKNNNRIAFEKIFKKYSERIYYFSYHYLKNKEESEEITQEVFVRLWNRRFDLKPELSFNSYLFMITKNAVIDLLRKRHKETSINESYHNFNNDIEGQPDNSLEYNELNNIVKKSVEELPFKRRQIFLMSREKGLTYKQIALKLNISIKTVESHMRLALKQLKKSIGDKYDLTYILIIVILL
ncbi:MAG: RNA polymerase sigma factor [Thiohalospira sp.]